VAIDTFNPPIPAQKIDDSVYRLIWELGHALIQDDRSDLYRTTYAHRPRHKYHGKVSPHHPSPIHHWMLGSILVLAAQFGALANTAIEAQQLAREMEEEEDEPEYVF
jgi:hypothetical protein